MIDQQTKILETMWANHSISDDLTFVEFFEKFKYWRIYPIYKRKMLIGGIVLSGPEAHVVVKPEFKGRWFTRKIFNDTIGKQLKEYGLAVTSCKEDSKNKDFIERLGYSLEVTKDMIHHFKMTENKYVWS